MEIGSTPWTEKYRPECFADVILEEGVRKQIEIFINDRRGVHLIITGVPGIGKTTTARCIAREILGENLSQSYMEMNSADERGVKSVSLIVPSFCRKITKSVSKVILLDEADNMTDKCQYDINNMIKQYGSTTKFIFTCNESHRIIQDVQSVCRIVRFRPLTEPQIIVFLKNICKEEKIQVKKGALETICYIAEGDMRKAVNSLQKAAYSFEGKIDKKAVLISCNVPDPEDINQVIVSCQENDLEKASTLLEELICKGYYYHDIIIGFTYHLSRILQVEEGMRLELIEIVHQTKINACLGLRTRLQLTAMIGRMIRIFNRVAE
jgi:replication factor C subunit 2/4